MTPAPRGWSVTETTGAAVLAALYLRQRLGLRFPEELPALRGAPLADAPTRSAELEAQWRTLWEMTVEPQGHPAAGPLALLDGFATLLAVPESGFDALRRAAAPYGSEAVAYSSAEQARQTPDATSSGERDRVYAAAVARHERAAGRPAHPFTLTVQVLPLSQRGVWWIGALTVAASDTLVGDAVAFDSAISPVIAELA